MEPIVQIKEIVKEFPGVLANDHISLDLYPGECHALVGENGAGKSTLMKILYGAYSPDGGQILIDGTEDALKALTDHYDIYVITNGLKAVQRGRFARTDITAYIKKIFISDEMNVQKPMKEFFDIVLSEIDERDKSKILVVGDSLTSDMQGGRNAGLDTCLFDPKDKVEMPDPLCDHKIHKLIELIDF